MSIDQPSQLEVVDASKARRSLRNGFITLVLAGALVVGLLLVYGVVFEPVGFIPCTLALLLILMWFVDPVRWWLAIIIAFAATFGVWAALTKWLKIQLPSGILNGIL